VATLPTTATLPTAATPSGSSTLLSFTVDMG
jgi:hypothetical protein